MGSASSKQRDTDEKQDRVGKNVPLIQDNY